MVGKISPPPATPAGQAQQPPAMVSPAQRPRSKSKDGPRGQSPYRTAPPAGAVQPPPSTAQPQPPAMISKVSPPANAIPQAPAQATPPPAPQPPAMIGSVQPPEMVQKSPVMGAHGGIQPPPMVPPPQGSPPAPQQTAQPAPPPPLAGQVQSPPPQGQLQSSPDQPNPSGRAPEEGFDLGKAWDRTGLSNGRLLPKALALGAAGMGMYGLYQGAKGVANAFSSEPRPYQFNQGAAMPAYGVNQYGQPDRSMGFAG